MSELEVRGELARAAGVLATGIELLREHRNRLAADDVGRILERLRDQTERIEQLARLLGPQELARGNDQLIDLVEAPEEAPAEGLLAAAVAGHLAVELRLGGSALLIAEQGHLDEVEAHVRGLGFPLDTLRRAGRFVSLDAHAVLEAIVSDGAADVARFDEVIGRLARSMRSADFGLRTFCEVGGLLREAGDRPGAQAFDRLWARVPTDDGLGRLGRDGVHIAA